MTTSTRDFDAIVKHAIQLRHDLHAHPELAFEERRTTERVRAELTRLGIAWEPCTDTGTLAHLGSDASDTDAPGAARGPRRIALRADLDALPVEEQTGLEYRSKLPGRMHACGHDGHTASLLAAAAWLKLHEAQLPGPVTLIFQPGEEGGHGAKRMIEAGALDGVDEVYGFHSWPAIPAGRAVAMAGTVMAANGRFYARARGRGGHASQPETCIDPIVTLAGFVTQVQQVVSRRVAPQRAAVVTVGSFHGGTASNIIPDVAECEGTIRASTTEELARISELCEQVFRGVCQAAGAKPEWRWQPDYPATVNHPQAAERAARAVERVLGPDALWDRGIPIMAAEDFSYFAERVPGCFLLLGAGREGQPFEACHSPRFDFDDALIPVVVRLWAELAGL